MKQPSHKIISWRTGMGAPGVRSKLSGANIFEDFGAAIKLAFPQARKITVGTFRGSDSIIAQFSLPVAVIAALEKLHNGFSPEISFTVPEEIAIVCFPAQRSKRLAS